MRTRAGVLRLVLPALAAGAALSLCTVGAAEEVRPAAVAGGFYPGRAATLIEDVKDFLSEAKPSVPKDLQDQRPRVLIVPHAGYPYSGRTAAACYKLLEGKKRPSRIVLIGPTHRAWRTGMCSVADFSHYSTPLGKIAVDGKARDLLAACEGYEKTKRAHEPEHCLEVQLPFLQVIWPDPPPIVPILVGNMSAEECRRAASGLVRIVDENTLLLVSTDFTHYGRRFGFAPFEGASGGELREKIKALDMEGVRHIESLNPAGFRQYLDSKRATICGRMAISIMLEVFSKSKSVRPVFLEWRNSGEVTGSYSDCVSYVGMALYASAESMGEMKKAFAEAPPPNPTQAAGLTLTDVEKRILLKLARDVIASRFEEGAAEPEPDRVTEALRGRYGAFVTLEKKGYLRGCIGHIQSNVELWSCVRTVAALAAFQDRRFPPLKEEELDDITLEISVLGPLTRLRDTDEISVGRDGLIVRRGLQSGLLLPQVATDHGWTTEEFLQQTCRKAGLPRDAWQEDDTVILRFSATVFGEGELDL